MTILNLIKPESPVFNFVIKWSNCDKNDFTVTKPLCKRFAKSTGR